MIAVQVEYNLITKYGIWRTKFDNFIQRGKNGECTYSVEVQLNFIPPFAQFLVPISYNV